MSQVHCPSTEVELLHSTTGLGCIQLLLLRMLRGWRVGALQEEQGTGVLAALEWAEGAGL